MRSYVQWYQIICYQFSTESAFEQNLLATTQPMGLFFSAQPGPSGALLHIYKYICMMFKQRDHVLLIMKISKSLRKKERATSLTFKKLKICQRSLQILMFLINLIRFFSSPRESCLMTTREARIQNSNQRQDRQLVMFAILKTMFGENVVKQLLDDV